MVYFSMILLLSQNIFFILSLVSLFFVYKDLRFKKSTLSSRTVISITFLTCLSFFKSWLHYDMLRPEMSHDFYIYLLMTTGVLLTLYACVFWHWFTKNDPPRKWQTPQ